MSILKLIPSGYKSGKVYSAIPTDGSGDFDTFTRSTEATRVNSAGFIETVAANIPRLDYRDGGCPVLLLENQKTNELSRSDDFEKWTKTNVTVESDDLVSPTGNLDADKITRNLTSFSYISKSFSKTDADEYEMTLSVFVKKNVGDFFAIRAQGTYPNRIDSTFQFSTETFTNSVSGVGFSDGGSTFKDYGNDWYRLIVNFDTDFAATLLTLFSPRSSIGTVDQTDSASNSSVYIWGAQCEYNKFSSYIPTTSAAVTRTVDICSITTPSGVVSITETYFDDSFNVITLIPTTYSISNGFRSIIEQRIKKVIME